MCMGWVRRVYPVVPLPAIPFIRFVYLLTFHSAFTCSRGHGDLVSRPSWSWRSIFFLYWLVQPSFKLGVDRNRALCASPTAMSSAFLAFTSLVFFFSTSFCSKPLQRQKLWCVSWKVTHTCDRTISVSSCYDLCGCLGVKIQSIYVIFYFSPSVVLAMGTWEWDVDTSWSLCWLSI